MCKPPDQMLEKPYVRSRGQIFSPIIMKLCQNVCLDKILDNIENGSYGVKTMSLGRILEKTLCTLLSPHFQSDYHETWSE